MSTPITGSVGLFLNAGVAPIAEIPLITSGSNEPGDIGTLTLFIDGGVFPENTDMSLFMNGSNVGVQTSNMNLWEAGTTWETTGSTTLFACNNQQGQTNEIPLFIQVDGSLLGGQSLTSSMPLFLMRPTEAGVTLFVCSPGT